MKFGPATLAEAEGAVLAHAIKQGSLVLKKGTRLGLAEIAALQEAGVHSVVVARLEAGDVGEDDAALMLAERLAGSGIRVEKPFTGRSNLYAEAAGVLRIDVGGIDRLNEVDEAVTVATLPANKAVVAGEMVGTVKIIPFAVPQSALSQALATAPAGGVALAPFKPKAVSVISTLLPGLKPSVVDKTIKVMASRIAPAGGTLAGEARVQHDAGALADALRKAATETNDMIVVFGASAITDRLDVIPAALEAAGGQIEHFGMPVDPGNLLLVGTLAGKPVLGAPGCARSPRENGFDWVLQRLLADVPVRRTDIQRMGVGGLLMEIVSRPQPRDPEVVPTAVDNGMKLKVVLLAAGRSSRMGAVNKLTAQHDGKPLVRIAAETAVASGVGEVIVVTGHQAETIEPLLDGLPVRLVRNPEYAAGMSTSLRAGVGAAGADVDGVIVALGDMPLVQPEVFRRLSAIFAENREAKAVVPTSFGERGNPVLIGHGLFPAVDSLEGDVGARRLIDAAGSDVVEVPVDDPGIHQDVDTPDALAKLPEATRAAEG